MNMIFNIVIFCNYVWVKIALLTITLFGALLLPIPVYPYAYAEISYQYRGNTFLDTDMKDGNHVWTGVVSNTSISTTIPSQVETNTTKIALLNSTVIQLTSDITTLQSQLASANATVQNNVTDIDYLYEIWEDVRDTMVTWLAGRP